MSGRPLLEPSRHRFSFDWCLNRAPPFSRTREFHSFITLQFRLGDGQKRRPGCAAYTYVFIIATISSYCLPLFCGIPTAHIRRRGGRDRWRYLLYLHLQHPSLDTGGS